MQATCLAFVIVEVDGAASLISIVPQLPAGLTANAAKAFSKWRFRPYLKDGQPVPGLGAIETSFQLMR